MKSLLFLTAAAFLLSGTSAYAADPTAALEALPGVTISSMTSSDVYVQPPRRYFRALGETIIIGWSPWLFSHYVKDYEYADISMDSVRRNFSNPPWWDADGFHTNMWGHPFQGSMYYNAARENGFNFWESAPFVAIGDFGWEYLMETEPPAYNDFSNTFFGGMERGEMTFRMSRMVRDNRAHGWEKFWREVGAGFINPVGFVDRLVFGDMFKDAPNPPDRFPDRFFMSLDAGFQHARSDERKNQGTADLIIRQNDPHEYKVKKPFDYYDLEATMATAKGPLIPFITYRGLLTGWDIHDDEKEHCMFAPGLTFLYFNNGPSSFGGSGIDFTVLSRRKMEKDFDIRTEVGAQGFIAAGIQTDYKDVSTGETGRNYDFGSGGGPKIDLRVRKDQVDWLRCSAAAGWFPTHNGLSSMSRIFTVTTEARYPIYKDLYAGVAWLFQERFTQYNELPSVTQANSAVRFFLTWPFRII